MNILVLTKTYPNPEDHALDGTTPVVRDFATAWAAAGHKVYVYHNYTKKPGIMNILPAKAIESLNKRFGYSLTPLKVNSSKNNSSIRVENGVRVARFPLLKLIPGRGFAGVQVKSQFRRIKKDLEAEKFSPDVIVAHWEDPQLQLLSMLKDVYRVPCIFTCHKIAYLNKTSYLKKARGWLKNVDALFVRSESTGRQLQNLLGLSESIPVCRSGISSMFFARPLPERVSRDGVLYVGRLLPYKNIDVLIEACQSKRLKSLSNLRIIGNGPEEDALRSLQAENVEFLGKQDHAVIVDELDHASVLSMVSTNETFGLSYLEAMARGCIVIAGDDGGMRGIIEDGVNGFLCPPGNIEALKALLEKIEGLTKEDADLIRANAVATASRFTQEEQAEAYLRTALELTANKEVQLQ